MNKPDYAAFTDAIRESVSAEQVGQDYGLNPGRDGRCRCCFCDGNRDDTLKLYKGNRGFYCYRCHKSGDVIALYRQVTGAGFRQAIEDLNGQYGLGLPLTGADPQAERRAREKAEQRRRERREKEEHDRRLLQALWDASDALAACDRVKREETPQTPSEGWSDRFTAALRFREELRDYRDRIFDELYGEF